MTDQAHNYCSANTNDTFEAQVLQGIMPVHVAIIMDGNGRWAAQQGLPRLMGHRRGAEVLKNTISTCAEIGLQYLTVFAFSTENWRRPADEVSGLMLLLKRYLKSELATANKNNIKIRVIGNKSRISPDIQSLITHAVSTTMHNTGLNLTIALDYGSRDEIINATRQLAQKVKDGLIDIDDIDEITFAQSLYTHELPDPDLFIRTSNVLRLSNFLLWQTAYTELYFLTTHWPEFSRKDLFHAFASFQKTERKFGAISNQP